MILPNSFCRLLLNPISKSKIYRARFRIKKCDRKGINVLFENWKTIPNFLCFTRACLGPVSSFLIYQHLYIPALGTVAVAAMTDFFDGYIARSFSSQKSQIGAILDPLADKIYIGFLTTSIAFSCSFPLWLAFVIVSRDSLLMIFSLFSKCDISGLFTSHSADLSPSKLGKLSTFVQFLTLLATIYCAYNKIEENKYLQTLWIICGCLTAVSGFSYLRKWLKITP